MTSARRRVSDNRDSALVCRAKMLAVKLVDRPPAAHAAISARTMIRPDAARYVREVTLGASSIALPVDKRGA